MVKEFQDRDFLIPRVQTLSIYHLISKREFTKSLVMWPIKASDIIFSLKHKHETLNNLTKFILYPFKFFTLKLEIEKRIAESFLIQFFFVRIFVDLIFSFWMASKDLNHKILIVWRVLKMIWNRTGQSEMDQD